MELRCVISALGGKISMYGDYMDYQLPGNKAASHITKGNISALGMVTDP
jgi:hypothetical protein